MDSHEALHLPDEADRSLDLELVFRWIPGDMYVGRPSWLS
jgi:hypothetical protein